LKGGLTLISKVGLWLPPIIVSSWSSPAGGGWHLQLWIWMIGSMRPPPGRAWHWILKQ
jgi:hypothetical protein